MERPYLVIVAAAEAVDVAVTRSVEVGVVVTVVVIGLSIQEQMLAATALAVFLRRQSASQLVDVVDVVFGFDDVVDDFLAVQDEVVEVVKGILGLAKEMVEVVKVILGVAKRLSSLSIHILG